MHIFSSVWVSWVAYSSPLRTVSLGPLSVSSVLVQILLAHSDIWEEYSIILTFLLFIPLGVIAWPEALCKNMENQYIMFWVSSKGDRLTPLIQWTPLKPQTKKLANPSHCCGFCPATALPCELSWNLAAVTSGLGQLKLLYLDGSGIGHCKEWLTHARPTALGNTVHSKTYYLMRVIHCAGERGGLYWGIWESVLAARDSVITKPLNIT